MPQQHHKIDYVEFLTPSTESVKRFYHQAFGWNFIDYGPSYTALQDAGLDGGFDVDKPNPKPLVIVPCSPVSASLRADCQLGPCFSFGGDVPKLWFTGSLEEPSGLPCAAATAWVSAVTALGSSGSEMSW